MVNPDVYPITHEFEKQFEDVPHQKLTLKEVKDAFQEVISEYEHGTAETQNCEGVTLKQYKEVASDLLLYRHGQNR